jgi:glycosyltransferase involved in cell wall biosynthesis
VRVLLVTHEASRSGAPRVAVLVARSLVEQGHRVHVVSRRPGPLLAEFAAVAPTALEPFNRVRRKLWSVPGGGRLAHLVEVLLVVATLLRRRPDLVYVNSAAAAAYLRPAAWVGARRLLHVHESGTLTARFLHAARTPRELDGITLVACSPSVQAELASLTGRAPETISLLPSVPDDDEVLRLSTQPPDVEYAEDDLVVGCCGAVEHRKGADQWVSVATAVRRALPLQRIRFVWVGPVLAPPPTDESAGVEFVGATANPYPHLRRFDLLTLPSRDDPFPLVVLEAMLLGTPVVAFGVGGVPQQIGDAGRVVPPGDVAAFADEVVALLTDVDARLRAGTASRARVTTLYSTSAFSQALVALVERPTGIHTSSASAPGPQA